MKILQTKKMAVARAVLEALTKVDGPNLLVEGYVNCREQGYSLTNWKVRVSFSEDRNTDLIVVQYGLTMDFANGGNVLYMATSTYAGREYFATPIEAAKFISDYFQRNPTTFTLPENEYDTFKVE